MRNALNIIAAAASAIVGLVKVAGLITGSQWLGDNWKTTLGYVVALSLAGLGLLYALLAVRPTTLGRFGIGARQSFFAFLPAAMQRPRIISALFGLMSAAFLLAAVAQAWSPDTAWWLGIFWLGWALAWGGIEAWEKRKENTKCPHCLETIKVKALVCRHCGRDVIERSPEDEGPDQVWL